MQEEGLLTEDDEPTDEQLRRYDKQRKNKKVPNDEWVSQTDADAHITKIRDGRTHLAYKAEYVVDLETVLLLFRTSRDEYLCFIGAGDVSRSEVLCRHA